MRAGLILLALLAGCTPPPQAAKPPEATAAAKPRREPPTRVAALLDQGSAAVETALGPPVLRRPEGAGEVWLYANATGCSIDIVLLSAPSGARVSNATTRTPPSLSEAACLRLIADQP